MYNTPTCTTSTFRAPTAPAQRTNARPATGFEIRQQNRNELCNRLHYIMQVLQTLDAQLKANGVICTALQLSIGPLDIAMDTLKSVYKCRPVREPVPITTPDQIIAEEVVRTITMVYQDLEVLSGSSTALCLPLVPTLIQQAAEAIQRPFPEQELANRLQWRRLQQIP